MPNILEIRRRRHELAERATKALADHEAGRISAKAFGDTIDKAWSEDKELRDAEAAYSNALRFAGGPPGDDGAPVPGTGGAVFGSKGIDNGKRLVFGSKSTAGLAAKMMGDGQLGTKALAPSGTAVVAQEFRDDPIALGKPAHSLLDVLPVIPHSSAEFAYMRQMTRTNNAAVVAEGAVKPTSVYNVERVEDKLDVIAHLSEGVPRYWFVDTAALQGFLSNELDYGLRMAVEAKALADVNATSGIQTQAYATSPLATLRKSLTLLEIAGYDPGYIVLDPVDWEGIELTLANQNAIDYQGIPYDAATRRLFGVPVVVSVAQAAGVSHTIARDAVALDTDDQGTGVQWSETSNADDWSRNLIRARCEGRFATSVFAPLGVVSGDLTA